VLARFVTETRDPEGDHRSAQAYDIRMLVDRIFGKGDKKN
jgi:hypothetical protein